MTPETDLLRRAAARVREVAEAASPGPWTGFAYPIDSDGEGGEVVVRDPDGFDVALMTSDQFDDCPHIALWDPTVALAVADILAGWADDIEHYGGNHRSDDRCVRLARQILEEPTPAPLVREDSHGSWMDERVGGEE